MPSGVSLTGFGHVEVLLQKVRHQSEDADEATKEGDYYVKVGYCKSRHLGECLTFDVSVSWLPK